MHKSTSRNMQKPRNPFKQAKKGSGGGDAAETNKRRSKYFWTVKDCVDRNRPLPETLPLWLTTEFNHFGGAAIWVRKNFYHQNIYRKESESREAQCTSMNYYAEQSRLLREAHKAGRIVRKVAAQKDCAKPEVATPVSDNIPNCSKCNVHMTRIYVCGKPTGGFVCEICWERHYNKDLQL